MAGIVCTAVSEILVPGRQIQAKRIDIRRKPGMQSCDRIGLRAVFPAFDIQTVFGSGYSVPKVSAVMDLIFWSSIGRSR